MILNSEVSVGQIYEDNAYERSGVTPRRVEVIRVNGTFALVKNVATKRMTSILLTRLQKNNSRGYRLIS